MNVVLRLLPPALLCLTAVCLGGCGRQGPAAGSDDQAASAKPPSPAGSRLGVNLAAVTDWTREWAFVDVFKSSRPWFGGGPGEVAFDADGNPLPVAGRPVQTLMVRELDGHYPGGVYAATYRGTGVVDMSRWDVRRVVRDAPGRLEADVRPGDGGIQLLIAESDLNDPIRGFHVWMPGREASESPFHPLFRERLKPFGVLRFMDWQRTNNSALRKWSQAPKPTDARYSTDAGVPVEVMIDLANECHSDPWFCMPHQADDAFIRAFAETVKARLDPHLKVYVEYSNEVWNEQFAAARWARQQGEGLNLGKPESLRYYARRSVEIFTIWERVFGGTSRLVRVLGAQFDNPWASEQVLTWEDAYRHADALAVAPYFGRRFGDPGTAPEVARKTVERLLDELESEVEGKNRELIQEQARVAAKYHLFLTAYEGGQHLAAFGGAENNEALTRLFIAANRHQRMYEIYAKHLTNWSAAGGGLYVAFSNVSKPGKWGSWGVLEYQDQAESEAPKYRALTDYLRARAARNK